MSENDATRDDAEHRSLGAALTDLAATMPDEPYSARRPSMRRPADSASASGPLGRQ